MQTREYFIILLCIFSYFNTVKTTTESTQITNSLITASITKIHRWCSSNHFCAEIYHQTNNQNNVTVFRFLMERIMFERLADLTNLNTSFSEFFELDTQDQIKELWILNLLANRQRYQTICDVNHKLVYDPITLIGSCECLENKNCNDDPFNLVFFYVLGGLFAAVVIILLFSNFYLIFLEYKKIHKIEQVSVKISRLKPQALDDMQFIASKRFTRKELKYGTFMKALN